MPQSNKPSVAAIRTLGWMSLLLLVVVGHLFCGSVQIATCRIITTSTTTNDHHHHHRPQPDEGGGGMLSSGSSSVDDGSNKNGTTAPSSTCSPPPHDNQYQGREWNTKHFPGDYMSSSTSIGETQKYCRIPIQREHEGSRVNGSSSSALLSVLLSYSYMYGGLSVNRVVDGKSLSIVKSSSSTACQLRKPFPRSANRNRVPPSIQCNPNGDVIVLSPYTSSPYGTKPPFTGQMCFFHLHAVVVEEEGGTTGLPNTNTNTTIIKATDVWMFPKPYSCPSHPYSIVLHGVKLLMLNHEGAATGGGGGGTASRSQLIALMTNNTVQPQRTSESFAALIDIDNDYHEASSSEGRHDVSIIPNTKYQMNFTTGAPLFVVNEEEEEEVSMPTSLLSAYVCVPDGPNRSVLYSFDVLGGGGGGGGNGGGNGNNTTNKSMMTMVALHGRNPVFIPNGECSSLTPYNYDDDTDGHHHHQGNHNNTTSGRKKKKGVIITSSSSSIPSSFVIHNVIVSGNSDEFPLLLPPPTVAWSEFLPVGCYPVVAGIRRTTTTDNNNNDSEKGTSTIVVTVLTGYNLNFQSYFNATDYDLTTIINNHHHHHQGPTSSSSSPIVRRVIQNLFPNQYASFRSFTATLIPSSSPSSATTTTRIINHDDDDDDSGAIIPMVLVSVMYDRYWVNALIDLQDEAQSYTIKPKDEEHGKKKYNNDHRNNVIWSYCSVASLGSFRSPQLELFFMSEVTTKPTATTTTIGEEGMKGGGEEEEDDWVMGMGVRAGSPQQAAVIYLIPRRRGSNNNAKTHHQASNTTTTTTTARTQTRQLTTMKKKKKKNDVPTFPGSILWSHHTVNTTTTTTTSPPPSPPPTISSFRMAPATDHTVCTELGLVLALAAGNLPSFPSLQYVAAFNLTTGELVWTSPVLKDYFTNYAIIECKKMMKKKKSDDKTEEPSFSSSSDGSHHRASSSSDHSPPHQSSSSSSCAPHSPEFTILVFVPQNTRALAYVLSPIDGHVVWKSDPGTSVLSALLSDDGTGDVFIASTNDPNALQRLDGKTGKVIWNSPNYYGFETIQNRPFPIMHSVVVPKKKQQQQEETSSSSSSSSEEEEETERLIIYTQPQDTKYYSLIAFSQSTGLVAWRQTTSLWYGEQALQVFYPLPTRRKTHQEESSSTSSGSSSSNYDKDGNNKTQTTTTKKENNHDTTNDKKKKNKYTAIDDDHDDVASASHQQQQQQPLLVYFSSQSGEVGVMEASTGRILWSRIVTNYSLPTLQTVSMVPFGTNANFFSSHSVDEDSSISEGKGGRTASSALSQQQRQRVLFLQYNNNAYYVNAMTGAILTSYSISIFSVRAIAQTVFIRNPMMPTTNDDDDDPGNYILYQVAARRGSYYYITASDVTSPSILRWSSCGSGFSMHHGRTALNLPITVVVLSPTTTTAATTISRSDNNKKNAGYLVTAVANGKFGMYSMVLPPF